MPGGCGRAGIVEREEQHHHPGVGSLGIGDLERLDLAVALLLIAAQALGQIRTRLQRRFHLAAQRLPVAGIFRRNIHLHRTAQAVGEKNGLHGWVLDQKILQCREVSLPASGGRA